MNEARDCFEQCTEVAAVCGTLQWVHISGCMVAETFLQPDQLFRGSAISKTSWAALTEHPNGLHVY